MKKNKLLITGILLCIISFGWTLIETSRPTVYLIGDSTVRNGKGKGDGGLWGWGSYLSSYFDTSKVVIKNRALGGTSSRTFLNKLWTPVLDSLKPGDFVIIQFGHNDNGAITDTSRSRGTIKGIGDEKVEVYNPLTKQQEVVYSYGWYLRKYIQNIRSKGAIPIICSPVPRNLWDKGKMPLDTAGYSLWAEQVAKSEKAFFIPLNKIIVTKCNKLGEEKVKSEFFNAKDHTHTIEAGAKFNASCVVEGINSIKECPLNKYLKAQ
jgi:lysophospholipase L1-like esterase